jgi:branched-subunit amino acid transport protein AzlD
MVTEKRKHKIPRFRKMELGNVVNFAITYLYIRGLESMSLLPSLYSIICFTLGITHTSKFSLAPFLVFGHISHRQFLSRLGKTRPSIIAPLLGYGENANYSLKQYLQGNGRLLQTCSINGLGMHNCLNNQHSKITCTQYLYVNCIALAACTMPLLHSDVIV